MGALRGTTWSRLGCLLLFMTCTTKREACQAAANVVDSVDVAPAPYPQWAHSHWVWLSHGGNGQNEMSQLPLDYMKYNITVGAVDVDSTWETAFNSFIPDTTKWPNMTGFIDGLHNNDIRVIFWITSIVDTDSPNYQEAHDKGYFLRDVFGKEATVKWWHGKGGMVDYTNPAAVTWWHSQMDKMLDLGIDGWKCDGTDPYVFEILPEARGHKGAVSYREYADAYYNDFYDYSRLRRQNESLIMSRPVDAKGPLYIKFSPKRVMYSGWVGDEDDTFKGLEGTLKRYLQSAWDGYANFGSDIGGYRTPQKPRQVELFLRWTQLGAFSPLMENGGGGEHRPWLIDPTRANFVVQVYRTFVNIHYALTPYLLSVGSDAMETGTSAMTPLAPHENFIEKLIDEFKPETYDYLLGPSLLVAPITENSTTTKIQFPRTGEWIYHFNSSIMYEGKGQKVEFDCPLSEFPVFSKRGAILPLNVTTGDTMFAPAAPGALTVLIQRPAIGTKVFTMRQAVDSISPYEGMELKYMYDKNGRFEFTASAHSKLPVTLVLGGIAGSHNIYAHDCQHPNGLLVDARVTEQQQLVLEARPAVCGIRIVIESLNVL